MSDLFSNHAIFSKVLIHRKLPVLKTYEFDFFRCVEVGDWVYGSTVSELHDGNLRFNNDKDRNRHSKLFPDEKISYWAESKATAVAEIKKHGSCKNYITFHAYDDASSTIPILDTEDMLVIIDGIKLGFNKILDKINRDERLTNEEENLVDLIRREEPDCLAYKSEANRNGTNFLFFERGFRKLSLKEVKLYMGENPNKNSKTIVCAGTSDYTPYINNYGKYFLPITKVKVDETFKLTEKYKEYSINYKKNLSKLR